MICDTSTVAKTTVTACEKASDGACQLLRTSEGELDTESAYYYFDVTGRQQAPGGPWSATKCASEFIKEYQTGKASRSESFVMSCRRSDTRDPVCHSISPWYMVPQAATEFVFTPYSTRGLRVSLPRLSTPVSSKVLQSEADGSCSSQAIIAVLMRNLLTERGSFVARKRQRPDR